MKNLKIGVAEVLQSFEKLSKKKIPEISSIRNIIYGDANVVLRKAVSSNSNEILRYYLQKEMAFNNFCMIFRAELESEGRLLIKNTK